MQLLINKRAMGNFNRDNRSGGDRGPRDFERKGRDFGGNKGFGGRNGGDRKFGGHSGMPRQMYQATCSKCGQSCEIPFKPTGDRPVFCRNCFKNQDSQSPRFAPKNFGGGSIGSNSGGTPSGNAGSAVSKAQFDSLNIKLDKILAILNTTKAEEEPKAEVKEVKASKKAIGKAPTSAKKSKAKKK